MATNKRGSGRGRSNTSGKSGANTRATGRATSKSDSTTGKPGGFMAAVKARPFASAAIAAGAAGASAFLWAKRAQLSDKVDGMSDKIGERLSSNEQTVDGADLLDPTLASPSPRGRRSKASIDSVADDQLEVGSISY